MKLLAKSAADISDIAKRDKKSRPTKKAFIFSCLTGLRWSDVYKLKWSEIVENEGKMMLIYRQKKTSELNYLPLSKQSLELLGDFGLPDAKVFKLPFPNYANQFLAEWCKSVGIEKKITYHSSRHTFAVLQLSFGTPIFTVQKLLGHTNISSTMVYADIVNTEKEKAMNIIPSLK